jgi:micrococcal nuclease
MRRLKRHLWSTFIILACAAIIAIFRPDALPAPTATATSTTAFFPVVRVVDGDTIAVEIDGANITVRLLGIDTPETVDPRKPVQCFGKEASDETKSLLTGKTVRLGFDSSQGTPCAVGTCDAYGRTLAYVFLPDGTDINETLIAQGFAREYTYDRPYAYQAEFQEAEARAREAKLGLWRACESIR